MRTVVSESILLGKRAVLLLEAGVGVQACTCRTKEAATNRTKRKHKRILPGALSSSSLVCKAEVVYLLSWRENDDVAVRFATCETRHLPKPEPYS